MPFARKAKVDVFGYKPIWDERLHAGKSILVDLYIENFSRYCAFKMGVWSEVWAVTGGGASHVDLPDKPTAN